MSKKVFKIDFRSRIGNILDDSSKKRKIMHYTQWTSQYFLKMYKNQNYFIKNLIIRFNHVKNKTVIYIHDINISKSSGNFKSQKIINNTL